MAREAIESLIVLVSPFAPHTAEELWEHYGHRGGLAAGRLAGGGRGGGAGREHRRAGAGQRQGAGPAHRRPDTSEAELERLALADPAVLPHLEGKTVKKVVVARGRLVSVVVG